MAKTNEVPDKKVAVIQNQLSPVVAKARAIVVKDEKSMHEASTMLSELNKRADMIEEEKQKVLKPLNEARTAEINRWKPVLTTLGTATDYLRNTIGAFQTAEIKRAEKQENSIADRVGEGKGKLKVETAVKKIEEIERPETSVNTDAGQVKFRKDPIVKIWDETMIPREFLVVDEKKILEALKAGVPVAGCELDFKMTPINFR